MKPHFPNSSRLVAAIPLVVMCLLATPGVAGEPLGADDFEDGLDRWRLEPPEQFEILVEPGTSNHVLQLTPLNRSFAHVVLRESTDWRDIRVEGRFLFPTEGDGYLGLLYNYQQTDDRMDFGCLYIKSNGSYVRVSPHYDGNPSWRLYPELQFDLEDEQRIQTSTWYHFRLDVHGRRAELFIEDMETPVVAFDLFPSQSGAIGLEARPGRGEPVWVDDIRVSKLGSAAKEPAASGTASVIQFASGSFDLDWEILGPLPPLGADSDESGDSLDSPSLPTEGWQPITPDLRGALITGRITQYRSGDDEIAYLRTSLHLAQDAAPGPTWFAVSAANRTDVWLNGYYRGTVAPERFIWSDYLTASEHPGARLPLRLQVGDNEIVLRVHGRQFAGGGLYAALVDAGTGRVSTQRN